MEARDRVEYSKEASIRIYMVEELTTTFTPPDGTVQGLVKVSKIRHPSALHRVSIWFASWESLT